MAPFFQRKSLVIRDDQPDFSVRVRYSTAHRSGADTDFPVPPPPVIAPAQAPMLNRVPKTNRSQSRRRLLDLSGQAFQLSRHLKDAARSRIADVATRVARNLASAPQLAVSLHGESPASSSATLALNSSTNSAEEQRWREFEASQRERSPEPATPELRIDAREEYAATSQIETRDAATDLLKVRAQRVLMTADLQEESDEGLAARQEPEPAAEELPTEPIYADDGKYGSLVNHLSDGVPQNWDASAEEPAMREESAHLSVVPTEEHPRSVKLDSSSNVIDISRESRFMGHLKFSGTIVVDGEVEGELEASSIVVRASGVVKARLSGDSIIVSGKVTGDIDARSILEATASAKLIGDVTTPELRLAHGATLKGRCTVGDRA